jgi:hypothetical protein
MTPARVTSSECPASRAEWADKVSRHGTGSLRGRPISPRPEPSPSQARPRFFANRRTRIGLCPCILVLGLREAPVTLDDPPVDLRVEVVARVAPDHLPDRPTRSSRRALCRMASPAWACARPSRVRSCAPEMPSSSSTTLRASASASSSAINSSDRATVARCRWVRSGKPGEPFGVLVVERDL